MNRLSVLRCGKFDPAVESTSHPPIQAQYSVVILSFTANGKTDLYHVSCDIFRLQPPHASSFKFTVCQSFKIAGIHAL